MKKTGLYRTGDWACISIDGDDRRAILREQYVADGYLPFWDNLQSKDDFDEHALGRHNGDGHTLGE